MSTVVEINSINKSYKDKKVLDNFSMLIDKGSFTVIMGESGSGKSTLLNIIGLLDKCDSGEVILFNQCNVKIFSNKAEKLLKDKIGYLFQNYALIDDKSVAYNLKIAMDKKDDQIIKEALNKVGLEGYEKKKIYQLSGGEQQRVAVARLLVKSCELVLCDEPTGSLDDMNKKVIFELLKELQNMGKTIIVVSHDKDIVDYANQVIVLSKIEG